MTTILALLALLLFGGEVIRSFTLAMLFGVVVRHLFVDLHRRAAADPVQAAARTAVERDEEDAGRRRRRSTT